MEAAAFKPLYLSTPMVETDHAVIDDEDEVNISEDIEDFRGTIETFIQNVKNNKSNKTYRTAFKRFKDSLKSNVSNEKRYLCLCSIIDKFFIITGNASDLPGGNFTYLHGVCILILLPQTAE